VSSIKITLYSNEGPRPEITSITSGPKEAAQIEWTALVGTAEHLLRNGSDQLSGKQLAAVQALVAASKESAS
jgi:hypothetical protein